MTIREISKYLLIFIGCGYVWLGDAQRTRVTFLKLPKQFSLDGLSCATKRYSEHRGVRYNLRTKECENLNKTWFSDLIVETGFNYFKIEKIDPIFEPTNSIQFPVPEYLLDGLSVIVAFEILSMEIIDGTWNIEFLLGGGTNSVIPLHMAGRLLSNMLVVASFIDDAWIRSATQPFLFEDKRVYEMKFVLGKRHVDIYLDRTYFLKHYQHVLLSNFKVVSFSSGYSGIICHRINLIYPE